MRSRRSEEGDRLVDHRHLQGRIDADVRADERSRSSTPQPTLETTPLIGLPRSTADDDGADAVPEGQLRASDPAVPPADDPGRHRPGEFAFVPRRSAIAEAQASGAVLWEMKKTAARDAWKEIEPGIARIAAVLTLREAEHAPAA
jgi:hypothetical protein